MKVNFRFLNLVVWGSIVLLLLVIAGCSLGAGSDITDHVSDPPSKETAEDEGGENKKQNSGKDQEAPEDGGNDEQVSGEDQKTAEGEDDGNEGQNPDKDQETPEDEEDGSGEQDPDEPVAESGDLGFLSWNIDYPEEKVWGAALTVSLKIDEDDFIPYKHFDLTGSGARNKKVSLPPGTYRMETHFLSHNVDTGSTEIVHIYSGQETGSDRVEISGSVFPVPQEFSSSGALKEYLNSQPENTAANPYPVKITGVDLSSKETNRETLKSLYDVLNQRYVTLDLSECTGTELISASISGMKNRANIVSMILPDSIIEINANGFSGYTSLKSVVMPKVKTINTSAFKNCGQLEAVFAPELETVTDAENNTTGAFIGCTALKALYCPALKKLGKYAVYGCTGLTEAAFPNLRTVGGLAFKGCSSLKALSLPAVTRIDGNSFDDDTALMYVIFGLNPPELKTNVFKDLNFSQNGVIYVPSDAVDIYKNTDLSNWSGLKGLVKPLPAPAVS
jgi:predicted nucleic-acid-binding Zn-ribbon protein